VPKMKTHRGAAKRFRRSGTGKIMTRKAWRGHNRHKKNSARWRRVRGMDTLGGKDAKRVDQLLG
jgi:large subunit ribosomal protein L35